MPEFFHDAPNGHLAFSDNGVVLHANAEAENVLGYTPDELTGKRVDSVMTVATKVFSQTHFLPLLRMRLRVDEVFMSLLAKDRTEVPVLVNASRKQSADGAVNHMAFMAVRQRKKFEDELVRAKKTAEDALNRNEELARIKAELEESKAALDKHLTRVQQQSREQLEYSTVIAHDLNEPLRKIQLFIDMLRRDDAGLNDRSRNALTKITGESERMRKLLAVMHEFLLVDTSNEKTSTVDLNGVLKEAEKRVRLNHPDVAWTLDADALPAVEGHARQLETLFFHLLDNAVRFREPGGSPVVSVRCDVLQENRFQTLDAKYKYADHARIAVSDNGVGFDNRYNDKVFQLFQKLQTVALSLGYGLALCRKIVKNHYGKIWASSEEGVGTTVTFSLPFTIQ